GVAAAVRAWAAHVAGGDLAELPFALAFWDGTSIPASGAVAGAEKLTIRVHRAALNQVLHEPNQLGLTRAFVSGALEVDGSMEALLALRSRFDDLELSPAERASAAALAVRLSGIDALRPPRIPASEMRPHGRRHSLRRDRVAVRHHYDVSNAFYRDLLGPTLVYSCAYFASPDESLEAAQERKLERICRKLRLAPDERLLDIGCGWGSLVLHAAAHHGAQAVGITLSPEQAALARERVREARLSDRVEIRVADYRELGDEPFDKVASVGMYEHVGASQIDAYATTIGRLLRPGGLALNHGISRLASTPSGPKSLIQRYVFPDGELSPLDQVLGALQGAGLEPRDVESLREHYTLTLSAWLANLGAERAAIHAEVGAERERVWRLYLLGSMLAFADADISVFQVLASRGGARHGLPLVRAAGVS
ncbi:MAG: cyclopropane-fatty-acyl-phospholipid synthase, partial [Baekduia sp.]|nr:cyclopropane-fatty-acyl-phospholipid synthase [Baekduia sp.]